MKTAIIAAMLLASLPAGAQEWNDKGTPGVNVAPRRTEFISYDMREDAEKGARAKNQHYLELRPAAGVVDGRAQYKAQFDVPLFWLDREIFLHVEGIPCYYVSVGDRRVAYGEDSRTSAEFNLSDVLTDGPNTITIDAVDGTGAQLEARGTTTPLMYIYSQPKLRIEDFTITAAPDSLNRHGILDVQIIVVNSYNFAEAVTVGYDIYAPDGKLQAFNSREVVVPGQGRDTVRFQELIYGTPRNLWSADKPALYRGVLTVQYGRRMTEYIPYKTGFGTTHIADGRIFRNGKAIDIKAARYNSAADQKTTADNLAKLKKAGINTICTDYPQPVWFYELCDATGLYVIDQANIHTSADPSNRDVGGSPANDPAFLPTFLDRTEAMSGRVGNHVCIIGWSLGGIEGNGYNFYKTYQWLKANDTVRAVIHNGAEGEWNTDMEPIRAADAREILNAPAPATTRRR